METHGVEVDRLAAPITEDLLQPAKSAGPIVRNFLSVLPFIAVGLAYAATQYAAHLKASRLPLHESPQASLRSVEHSG